MDLDLNKAIDNLDFFTNSYVDIGNGLMLTNGEINCLKRFGVNYLKCNTLKEILYQIETILEEDDSSDLDELDLVAMSIAERDYYQNTNK